MSKQLTKQEKEAVTFALKYYKDEATTQDNGRVGLIRDSKEYKLLTSAIKKLQS